MLYNLIGTLSHARLQDKLNPHILHHPCPGGRIDSSSVHASPFMLPSAHIVHSHASFGRRSFLALSLTATASHTNCLKPCKAMANLHGLSVPKSPCDITAYLNYVLILLSISMTSIALSTDCHGARTCASHQPYPDAFDVPQVVLYHSSDLCHVQCVRE